MKPSLEHIAKPDTASSVVAYWREEPGFAFNWHYHPEYELTYIHRGSGSRLVGDQVAAFHDGDLVLLGPNLPHTWSTDENGAWEGNARAVVVQFRPEVLNGALLHLPELAEVKQLLEKSGRGMVFHASVAEEAARRMAQLPSLSGLDRLSGLLLLLRDLGRGNQGSQLASALYSPSFSRDNEQRIDRAFQLLHQRYTEQISLADLAAEVHMTETSFCRFFKKMTGKAYTDYLNDLRVNRACRLLAEGEDSMSAVAYSAGFGSMTHFNRMFFNKKKMSPGAWRRKFNQQKP
ncbi:MAG: AraC family transcriptional regulator [Saprospiraceae bacterium]|jgi:AraC-like DNA-binding protein|nr:AraC family transcriptional regulator [Saprospiraceae bacterium]